MDLSNKSCIIGVIQFVYLSHFYSQLEKTAFYNTKIKKFYFKARFILITVGDERRIQILGDMPRCFPFGTNKHMSTRYIDVGIYGTSHK